LKDSGRLSAKRKNGQPLTVCPEDFIVDYSPRQRADLFLLFVDERPPAGLRGLVRQFYRWLFGVGDNKDANDAQAEKAWQTMNERYGNTNAETVTQFLTEKFDGVDHLRKFEYSFLARCLTRPDVKTNVANVYVDMGGGNSYSTVVPILLRLPSAQILSVDVVNHTTQSKYGVRYVRGDCMNTYLSDESADVVTLISTLEHIGLGRWGDPLDVNGDIKTMREAWRILKLGGHVVLTIPYGYPTVVYNLHRIYDAGRLSLITQGFEIVLEEYSLMGQTAQRENIEGVKMVREIPGYYKAMASNQPEIPGGGMFLLRKVKIERE
jgi:SAM-dependent methyltransferase